MSPGRWRQVFDLCDSALSVEPSGRLQFLDEACGEDRQLREEAAALLAVEAPSDFLEMPAVEMAASMLASPAPVEILPPGLRIGPFSLLERIGSGGMGQVYKATDTRLGRAVAMKFIPIEASRDRTDLERFQREARAASALSHPNICSLYDIGEHEGQPFLVMEMLEGQSLKERLVSGHLPPLETAKVGAQIANALEAAHAKGIVHRDIKPGNIFLTEGQAKILDFGLAKLQSPSWGLQEAVPGGPVPEASQDTTITIPGRTMGTVAYMSPEQALGETVDRRTDLFSLGVTLYEMATGVRPFAGATTAMALDATITRQPVRPRKLNPALPAELERIILKALEKEKTARYQSASGLRRDLEKFDVGRPRLIRWAVAAALLLVAAAAPAGLRFWFERTGRMPELTRIDITANPADDPVIRGSISPDGQYVAFMDLAGVHLRRISTGETRHISPEKGCCFR